MRTFILLAFLAIFSVACGGGTETTDSTTEEMEAPAVVETKVTISPMPASPDFPDAAIKTMDYNNGNQFVFTIDGGKDGYELGAQTNDAEQKMCANSAKGQHIHLILDNEPYVAKYEAQFDYTISEGEHYVLAFLSRSYHESIKHAEASRVTKTTIDKTGKTTSWEPVTEPMLFYSRPKGTYTGKDTENLMLDFYLANVTLGDDYKVKAEVAGETFMIDTWQPYFLKGMPMGEHTVTLTLVDAEGKTVDTPLNPVSRTITLAEDKAEE
ncbi:hypothetical protein [Lewinella cohaerens]|uniref:hypothetical protein n=1 Tax=Lewinella cohaerens TaxID=70995 RepID=UPI0003699A7F|nr:hypothetical protein [Lewinella cohaerens]